VAAPVLAASDPGPARFGAAIASFAGAPLLVAAVATNDDVATPLAIAQLGEGLPADVTAALDAAAREVGGEPLPLGGTSVPAALHLAATELGARMVAAPVGSTGARLLNGAPCPVAVVAADWTAPQAWRAIGAGLADTAESRAAVRAAHALADRSGADLRILSVVGSEEARSLAEDAAAAAPAGPGARVDVDVVVGDPAAVLRAATREVDVLICGARSYGPAGATLLGGVTREVTADGACPVIVLARGTRGDLV
jgi:nucleotide-binding universal stress UspA family protein